MLITDKNLEEFSKLLYERTGLYFSDEKKYELNKGLKNFIVDLGFDNADAGIQLLSSSRWTEDIISLASKYFAIGETYFFRDDESFKALEYLLISLSRRTHKNKVIKIWSAACSTGEEAYSIAITINKIWHLLNCYKVEVVATDINKISLKKAEAGAYSNWSFRNLSAFEKALYFNHVDNDIFQVNQQIRRMVTFKYLNLIENVYPYTCNEFNGFDIIFCRNVLMYFSTKQIERIKERFYFSLNDGGYLFLTPGEMSTQFLDNFNSAQIGNALVYQKKNLVCKNLKQESKEKPKIAKVQTKKTILEKTNEGYKEVIANKTLDSKEYLLLAIELEEQGKFMDAEAVLKKAIYIEPDFAIAYFTLANIYRKQGKNRMAQKNYQITLQLLEGYKDYDILPESGGLTAGYVAQAIDSLRGVLF